MHRSIFAAALACVALAAPALAQQVPTSTALAPSAGCLTQAVDDFRSAWQQTAGNPYYDQYEDPTKPKNGLPDSIEAIFAVQAAARGCTFRAASAAVSAPDPAALDQARRDGAAAVKARVRAALENP